jgi:hypothetical protein
VLAGLSTTTRALGMRDRIDLKKFIQGDIQTLVQSFHRLASHTCVAVPEVPALLAG